MKKKNKFNKHYHILVIIMFFLPLLFIFGIIFRGQREISDLENRSLVTFPKLTFNNFKNSIFQDDIESALSDQFMFSQSIKKYKRKITNNITSKERNTLINNKDVCNYYVNIAANFYNYNCSNYLIEKYNNEEYDYSYYKDIYNNINFKEKYIYFIEKDRTIDFNNIALKENIFNEILDNFDAKGIDRFTIDSYDYLEKYFYQTDHHWNYEGQYRAYTHIISMLLGYNENTLEPINKVTYDVIFNGSASRMSVTDTSKEKFTVYKYNIPEYKVYINDEESTYGDKKLYDDNKYSKELYTNHYSLYYGADYAKVVYDFNNPNKKNLLMIATSYSNSINELIASHFNKTYIIDLRHYEDEIDFNEFIKDNNIDKVLIMGDINSFANGGEK